MTDFFETLGRIISKFWSFILVGLFLICTAALYMTVGGNSEIWSR